MYLPSLFHNEDIEQVRAFIEQNALGIVVSDSGGRPWASHVPLLLERDAEGRDILSGHLSKANMQWKEFGNDRQVLAIFSGPHAYVSSSWYDHENVPTWNYIAVHVYGRTRLMQEEELLVSLKHMSDKYEKNSKEPFMLEHLSEEYLQKQLKGIAGFVIEIEEIKAKYKLSQNRDSKNYSNIIKELEARGDAMSLDVAEEMRKLKKNEDL